jgi:hypothetical protein
MWGLKFAQCEGDERKNLVMTYEYAFIFRLPCRFVIAARRAAPRARNQANPAQTQLIAETAKFNNRVAAKFKRLMSILRMLDRWFEPDSTVEEAIWSINHSGVFADYRHAKDDQLSLSSSVAEEDSQC